MADREQQTLGRYSKMDEFTVCALRGFGTHKTVLGTGTYGSELEQCLRRQARCELDKLRKEEIRFPINNRVAQGGSAGRRDACEWGLRGSEHYPSRFLCSG